MLLAVLSMCRAEESMLFDLVACSVVLSCSTSQFVCSRVRYTITQRAIHPLLQSNLLNQQDSQSLPCQLGNQHWCGVHELESSINITFSWPGLHLGSDG